MAVNMPGWCTCNTDAGFYKWNGLGSFAYWIRFEGQLFTGSGVLKEECRNSTDAERKAIMNAIYVIKKQIKKGIVKIIFNRDNINVKANPDHPYDKLLYEALKDLHEHFVVSAGGTVPFEKFYEFRHVRAHSSADNKRTWVNNRLDEMCSTELKNETKRRSELNKHNMNRYKKTKKHGDRRKG